MTIETDLKWDQTDLKLVPRGGQTSPPASPLHVAAPYWMVMTVIGEPTLEPNSLISTQWYRWVEWRKIGKHRGPKPPLFICLQIILVQITLGSLFTYHGAHVYFQV